MIIAHTTFATAAQDLGRQIAARFGTDPELLSSLRFEAKATRHVGSDRKGITLICYPASGLGGGEDVLLAYYGAPPLVASDRR